MAEHDHFLKNEISYLKKYTFTEGGGAGFATQKIYNEGNKDHP